MPVPRLALYGVASTTLASAVFVSALHSRPNFFAAAVAVGRSSGSLLVLANFALFNTICVGIAFKRVFFGQLRAIEYEHLFERLWIFLTESLLALTIFRDDFSPAFAVMYGVLVFLKCFHWITADRVDYMDQIPAPGPPRLFHLRVVGIIAILAALDLLLLAYATESILIDGVSAMLLFASEFAILVASIAGTGARYVVGVVDLRRAGGRDDAPSWEEKSMWMFYIDLAVDFAKLITYLVFFTIILLNYGLPLHILRDVYMTLRSFLARCADLVRYRAATRNMDALYPDATEAELAALGDRTCIICREEMVRAPAERPAGAGPNETPKRLACGHIFHFHCLRSWLERQQSCPTCRRDVLTPARRPQRVAPPQPGARAQLNEANRIAFEEYFRFPAPNGDAVPPRPPAPGPTAAPVANGAPPPTVPPALNLAEHVARHAHGEPTRADRSHEAAHDVQRSIWGAPVIPGQFFAQPLGTAPRLGAAHMPPGLIAASAAAQRDAERQGARGAGARAPASPGVSGSTTPFSSQAPAVFSLPGRHVPGVHVGTDAETASESATQAASDSLDPRRAAAEAAQRRASPQPAAPSTATAAPTKPYLSTLELPAPHPRLDLAAALPRAPTPRSAHDAREQLDDRLRVLRDVQAEIGRLVGELGRVRDEWAREDRPGDE
ncbi:E3 ubiquitin-protein ligase hrd1 [Cryptotrichosporon argae]